METISLCQHCGLQTQQGVLFCCSACELLNHISSQRWSPSDQIDFQAKKKKYTFLQSSEVLDYYAHNKIQTEFVFYVEGLQCASCVHLIEKLPDFSDQILQARVNFANSTLHVQVKPKAPLGEVLALLEELGYKAWPLSKDESLLQNHKNENRDFLKRIAVAGACTGNIMIFTIPIYAGLEGIGAQAFNLLSFFIFLPIIFYSAVPFYRGALNSLKYRVLSVDLPIVIALWSGFIFSSLNLLNQRGEIYFDSTASFIFLILCTRFAVKRLQQTSLGETNLGSALPPQTVQVKSSNGWVEKTSLGLTPGDIIGIEADQTVPADGVLTSLSAEIDSSLMTGESLPQKLNFGMKVLGGTKVLSSGFEMKVEQIGHETMIGKILTQLEKESLRKTPLIGLADIWSQRLIAGVFFTAIAFILLASSSLGFEAAFQRALALIVIACPCSMAFGAPLSLALSLRRARQFGILIKDGGIFEKILECKKIFFDKTGTLTMGRLRLAQSIPENIGEDLKEVILGLELNSYHPIAFAFREAFPNSRPREFSLLNEQLGTGVSGNLSGDSFQWQIETSNAVSPTGLLSVALKYGKETKAYFYFQDQLHSNTKHVFDKLKSFGYFLGLISGDQKQTVDSVAQEFKFDFVKSNLKPEEKSAIIRAHPYAMMIGDGANDALSLKVAHVGIAVRGSVPLSLESCDIYLLKSGLQSLINLIDLSKKAKNTLKRNLMIALTYNVLAGALALLGYINPLAAAVLMPISSIVILINAFWGVR